MGTLTPSTLSKLNRLRTGRRDYQVIFLRMNHMGRKLIGITVGLLLTIVLAFYLFPPQYNALVSWLAPFFGSWLRFAFMFLFILLADPFAYTTVLILWVVVGLVAGLLARSTWGSIGIGIIIFAVAFLLMVLGFANIIIPMVSDIGSFDFTGLLGAIPPDVSMFDILGSPVIGDIISLLMENMASLPDIMADPTNILSLILSTFMPIIINGVKNLIILIVCIFIGGFIGRLIKKPENT